MKKSFRSGELERAYHVLFSKQSHWQWPFFGEDLADIALELGCSTLFLSLIIGIFVKFELTTRNFLILAGTIFTYETVKLNWDFMKNASIRRKYRRRYLSQVEHTEAYSLLEDALEQRRKGAVKGLGDKKETERVLMRLWKTAFAEADRLHIPTSTYMPATAGDPLSDEPISTQIQSYFGERKAAYDELDEHTIEVGETT